MVCVRVYECADQVLGAGRANTHASQVMCCSHMQVCLTEQESKGGPSQRTRQHAECIAVSVGVVGWSGALDKQGAQHARRGFCHTVQMRPPGVVLVTPVCIGIEMSGGRYAN